MELLDARRLTGPNLFQDQAGTVLDIQCSPEQAAQLVPQWESRVRRMLEAIGVSDTTVVHRLMTGGVSLFFTAPVDLLYSATEINEWAWQRSVAESANESVATFDQQLDRVRESVVAEANPQLLVLQQASDKHQVSLLWDDELVSIGHGSNAQTWPFRELPDAGSIDWKGLHDIPTGIVTGTNGKTTTVRMARHILQAAGQCVGVSSTDWIAVDDTIIDRGDWSGPGGARQVLRQAAIDVAILETARGGLLRRGLGVNHAGAALITNLSEDHLGDFGSRNLDELLAIKWIVSRAVETQGVLILNADDALLVAKSADFHGTLCWFSLDAENPVISRHMDAGGTAFVLRGEFLARVQAGTATNICRVDDIPLTMRGAARHNISNALAAAALTSALGSPVDGIANGLRSMSWQDNPGRANLFQVEGVNVLVDFAHNPAAMEAILKLSAAIPANRRCLAFSQAGDRPDELIRQQAAMAWATGIDVVMVSELADYHRGRSYGEVYALIRDELLHQGADEEQLRHFDEETDTLQAALDWAEPGDLVIMLALGNSAGVRKRLEALSGPDAIVNPDSINSPFNCIS